MMLCAHKINNSWYVITATQVTNILRSAVLLTPDCVASPLVRVTGQAGTELAGPAVDPLGVCLYFSSQRAAGGKKLR